MTAEILRFSGTEILGLYNVQKGLHQGVLLTIPHALICSRTHPRVATPTQPLPPSSEVQQAPFAIGNRE